MDVPSPAARHGHRPQGEGRRPGQPRGPDPAARRPVRPAAGAAAQPRPRRRRPPRPPKPACAGKGDYHAEVLVLGAGPGGYSAAFRAADLGRQVVLVERWPTLGGVCLNVGCIPSKALLHAAKVIAEAEEMGHFGVKFAAPHGRPRRPARLEGRRRQEADRRPLGPRQGAQGHGRPGHRPVHLAQPARGRRGRGGKKIVTFDQAIIAAGSEPVTLPFIPHADPRVINSTGALELGGVPKRLLVVGGGIIGLEMATVYHALGAKVTIVELMDQIIPGADKDLVTPLHKRIGKHYENIFLKAKVTKVEAKPEACIVSFEGGSAPATRHLRPHPRGGRQEAQRQGDRRRERRRHRRRARLHPGRQANAHQRPAHLRHRRRGRPADAGPQGGARGQDRRPRRPRA